MVAPKVGTCVLCFRKDIPVRRVIDDEGKELLVCSRCKSKVLKNQSSPKIVKDTPKIRDRELPDLEQFESPPKIYTRSQKEEIVSKISKNVQELSRNVQELSEKLKKSLQDVNLKEKIKISSKIKEKLTRPPSE